MHLYFIAIVPEQELREKVKRLKEEISHRFQAKHALKSPAHITLQMPFKRPETIERELIAFLQQFAKEQSPFEVHLNGFDHFSDRVLFIKVENHHPVRQLHQHLMHELLRSEVMKTDEVTQQVHPHMTLATRDLHKEAFHRAWPELEARKWKEEFMVRSLFLLKHNGKNWDIFQECPFGRSTKETLN